MQWHVALVGTELGCTAWSMQPGTAVNANALIQEDEFADAKELQSAMHNSESCVTTCLNSLDAGHKMCRTKDLVQCVLIAPQITLNAHQSARRQFYRKSQRVLKNPMRKWQQVLQW